MSPPWHDRVHAYCDTLEATLFTFRGQLQAIRESIVGGDADILRTKSELLIGSLEALQSLVAEREQLLKMAPIPAPRLTEALKRLGTPHADSLADRCKRLAQELQAAHRETMSIFVAEYHLIQTTEDLLALLTSGSLAYSSYSHPDETPSSSLSHGRILDKAA